MPDRPPLTFEIPPGANPTECRGCKALVYWIRTEKGKLMPVDPGGVSHFATCKDAAKFRKAKK
jgi:hypothetical protein